MHLQGDSDSQGLTGYHLEWLGIWAIYLSSSRRLAWRLTHTVTLEFPKSKNRSCKQSLLRSSHRTHMRSLPPHSISQSKSHGHPIFKGWGNRLPLGERSCKVWWPFFSIYHKCFLGIMWIYTSEEKTHCEGDQRNVRSRLQEAFFMVQVLTFLLLWKSKSSMLSVP